MPGIKHPLRTLQVSIITSLSCKNAQFISTLYHYNFMCFIHLCTHVCSSVLRNVLILTSGITGYI